MYDFHYFYVKIKYDDKAKLLFTDTGSLVYENKMSDFYFSDCRQINFWISCISKRFKVL